MTTKDEIGVYICGKHYFKTNDFWKYNLHIINEHDTEHGIWQEVGDKQWTVQKPVKRNGKMVYDHPEPYYGNFRYLRMFFNLKCARENHKLVEIIAH